MEIFEFIKWGPIGFARKIQLFTSIKNFWSWCILFIVVWCICIVFYYISLIFLKIPVTISSLALGILIAIILEWLILDKSSLIKTIKHVSIPFMCIVILLVRFMMESAIFHAQDNPLSK